MDVVISIVCSVIGAIVAVWGMTRYVRKDTQEDTASSTRLETKLDYVSKGVDDIRLDIKDQGRKIDGMNERLTRVEESAKSAHHRIDGIEEKINVKGE